MVVLPILWGHHAIATDIFPWGFFDCDHIATATLVINFHHLGETARMAIDNHVWQQNRKRLMANKVSGAPNRMAETQRFLLPREAGLASAGQVFFQNC